MSEKREPRRGLGRGLSALMADVEPRATETDAAPETNRRSDRMVPVERIIPNPDQPRRTFTEAQLTELAELDPDERGDPTTHRAASSRQHE